MVSTKEKMEFVYMMSKHSSLPLNPIYQLMRWAVTYQRIMEHHCNGTCPQVHYTVNNDYVGCPKADRLEKRISDELSTYECKAIFQGDPRGCCVKVVVPDGATNDMGQEGICVPA